MKRIKWLLAVLLAFAMLAAACGGDDDDTDAGAGDDAADSGDDGDSADDGDDMADDGDDMADDDMDDGDAAAELVTGVGVSDDTIRIGFLSDLSGIFAGLTVPITDGSQAYFDRLNDQGGIAGRMIEVVVRDTGYDVPTHLSHYDELSSSGDDGVIMIGTSTGSPHTAAIRDTLVEDDMAAIVLSWNSSWAAPNSSHVFEWGTNYCVEAMNGVSWLADAHDAATIAIVSFPGDYGEDGALGAKIAAEALGLEVVYDGQAAVIPNTDQTPVISQIVESGADIVWTTLNPGTLAEVMGGAHGEGFVGQWGGNGPSFAPQLLATDLGPLATASYTAFTPYTAIGTGDTAGMADVVSLMREYAPDKQYLSVYINSWLMGEIARQGLLKAVENGDLTRAGVAAALQSIEVDFQGLASNSNYAAEDPNDQIARGTWVYKPDHEAYNGDSTMLDDEGEGLILIEENYISDTAAAWEYEPCFLIE